SSAEYNKSDLDVVQLTIRSSSHLTFEHLQPRDGQWVIVDLEGKRIRIRSVPFPLLLWPVCPERQADVRWMSCVCTIMVSSLRNHCGLVDQKGHIGACRT